MIIKTSRSPTYENFKTFLDLLLKITSYGIINYNKYINKKNACAKYCVIIIFSQNMHSQGQIIPYRLDLIKINNV